MQLRPYQTSLIEELRDGFRRGFTRQGLVSPTGSGKTVLFSYVVKNAAAKGLRVWVIAHRAEILDQISATLSVVGVQHGMVRAGEQVEPKQAVQVASIQTLVRRFDQLPSPDFIVIDECHHSTAGQWAKVFAQYPKAKFLGVTATPERLDGRGLGEFFQTLVRGPEVQWLFDYGFLAVPVYYAPKTAIDVSSLRKMAGEFSKQESAELMDKPSITGDAVAHYRKYALGCKAVAFCVNLKHAEHVAEQFRAAGIPSATIDGTLTRDERRQRVADLTAGRVSVLTSCEIVSEGFDLPSVDAAILLRPTASLALHLQQVGRALRVSPGKQQAVILDHVGNCLRHGLAEERREWSLEGGSAKKRKKDDLLDTRQCEKCYAVFTGTSCPQCGEERVSKARELEQREGELEALDAEKVAASRMRLREEGKAQTLADLMALAKQRGYRAGWAIHRFNARKQRHSAAA